MVNRCLANVFCQVYFNEGKGDSAFQADKARVKSCPLSHKGLPFLPLLQLSSILSSK